MISALRHGLRSFSQQVPFEKHPSKGVCEMTVSLQTAFFPFTTPMETHLKTHRMYWNRAFLNTTYKAHYQAVECLQRYFGVANHLDRAFFQAILNTKKASHWTLKTYQSCHDNHVIRFSGDTKMLHFRPLKAQRAELVSKEELLYIRIQKKGQEKCYVILPGKEWTELLGKVSDPEYYDLVIAFFNSPSFQQLCVFQSKEEWMITEKRSFQTVTLCHQQPLEKSMSEFSCNEG